MMVNIVIFFEKSTNFTEEKNYGIISKHFKFECYKKGGNIKMEKENINEDTSLDSIDLYMKEVRKISLPILTPEEEKILIDKVKKGDQEAKNLFLEKNLLLVVSIAKNYTNQGISFLDLIQEGNLALMRALDYFKIEKNCKFSTYAI